jgi:hypothetical protein
MATEQERADLSIQRGKVSAGMVPSADKKAFIAKQGEQEAKGKDNTSELGQEAYRQRNINAVQGSFKKGGTVPKTGIYQLHKGEKVIPKHKADKMVAHGANKNMIHPNSSANHKRYSFGKE